MDLLAKLDACKILSTFIKLPFVINIFVLPIFKWTLQLAWRPSNYYNVSPWRNTHHEETCSFLHAHFSETMKVDENLKKNLMVKNSIIGKTYVVGTHWNCLYEAIPMCTYNICY